MDPLIDYLLIVRKLLGCYLMLFWNHALRIDYFQISYQAHAFKKTSPVLMTRIRRTISENYIIESGGFVLPGA